MGTQQLLLIALGVIVAGAMVVTGISMMQAYAESSNREQIISNIYDLGLMAQSYYKKSGALGGGGKSFSGWKIPDQLANTETGKFTATVRAARVNLNCRGKYNGRDGRTLIRVTARIDTKGIKITVVN